MEVKRKKNVKTVKRRNNIAH